MREETYSWGLVWRALSRGWKTLQMVFLSFETNYFLNHKSSYFRGMFSLSKAIISNSVNVILKLWIGSDTLTYIINKTRTLFLDCFPTVSLEF